MSWRILSEAGHEVVFATPSGQPGQADDIMVTGRGLDPWGAVPLLRNVTVVGRVLRADAAGRRGLRGVARRRRLPFPVPLGCGPAQRLRRARPPGRAPRPGDARLPREPRGSADGGRLLPRRQAGRGDLSRRARGGARHRPSHRALRPARPAHHGADLAARAQGMGTRQPDALLGRRLLPHLRGGAGQPAGFMSVQQEVTRALADRGDFVDVPPASPTTGARRAGGRATP